MKTKSCKVLKIYFGFDLFNFVEGMIIRPKLPPYQRPKTINWMTKKQKMISQTILKDLPSGTELLENQVAGHTFQIGTDEIGNLNENKSVLCSIAFQIEKIH